jgi:hypothetical protein
MMIMALVLGPAVVTLSAAFILPLPTTDSVHDDFTAMITNRPLLLISSLLEGVGFTITLGGYAAIGQFLRRRGVTLATIGAALCVVGILGFGWAGATGFVLHALTGMTDHDAAFAAAQAIASDPANSVSSMLEIVGPIGVLLLMLGLFRARIVPLWPVLVIIAGILANGVIGTVVATFVADLLLLAGSTWVAVYLMRVRGPELTAEQGEPSELSGVALRR